jgi:uncharacterized protein YeaO (DUF488 family)
MPVPRARRVYEPPAEDDGLRVLVDRLWPRGLSKAKAQVDEWLKEIAPSPELRKRFHADPERWDDFREAYLAEARANPALPGLRSLARKQRVTLLYAFHDEAHNHAVLLRELLR